MEPVLSPATFAKTAQRGYVPQGMIYATSEEKAYNAQSIQVASNSAVKRYMDVSCVTDRSSRQYKLLQKGVVGSDGIVRVNGYIAAALGSRYGSVGSKFIFILQDGKEEYAIRVIKADQKRKQDTLNSEGWLDPNGNILEMIVCTDRLNSKTRLTGDCNYTIRGEIIRIYKEK